LKQYDLRETPEFSFHWSPHPGEENIIYAIRKPRKMVIRINVDTQEEADVVSYDPGDGRDESPRACGWTTDKFLLVVLRDRDAPTYGGGFEIDVLRRTRKPFAEWPKRKQREAAQAATKFTADEFSDQWRRYQKNNLGSGHGGRSPSGRYAIVNPGILDWQGVVDTKTGEYFHDNSRQGGDAVNRCYPYVPNYCNWNASENWYVMNSSAEQGVNGRPAFGTKPEIQKFPIWQVYFFGSKNPREPFAYRKLMVVRSSVGWYDEKKELRYMEASRIHINVSRDARWLYYVATDGNYHEVDYAASLTRPQFAYVGKNWSTCGVFLAQCEPARE
jgi:hypothetical protein